MTSDIVPFAEVVVEMRIAELLVGADIERRHRDAAYHRTVGELALTRPPARSWRRLVGAGLIALGTRLDAAAESIPDAAWSPPTPPAVRTQ